MDNTADTVTKEYKVNESVLVTYHTLGALYQQFFSMYPKELGNKIVNLKKTIKKMNLTKGIDFFLFLL